MDKGFVKSLPDIYHLTKDDLLHLPGYADKSAENLLTEIKKAGKITLDRLIYGLGIPLLGSHMVQVIVANFKDLSALEKVEMEELQQIEGVGPEVARSIVSFFADEKNQRAFAAMLKMGLKIDNPAFSVEEGDRPLQDLKFVFTGSLENWTRDEVQGTSRAAWRPSYFERFRRD